MRTALTLASFVTLIACAACGPSKEQESKEVVKAARDGLSGSIKDFRASEAKLRATAKDVSARVDSVDASIGLVEVGEAMDVVGAAAGKLGDEADFYGRSKVLVPNDKAYFDLIGRHGAGAKGACKRSSDDIAACMKSIDELETDLKLFER